MSKRIKGICNHFTRPHIRKDLYRYLFASCFAEINERSPFLRDYPVELLPNHKSVSNAIKYGYFNDRFRVQVYDRPSTTVTSHLAKDGHYFIHPDPFQCRSMTVREVARLQAFPDDYYFCGSRSAKYIQVGNAVPPLLSREIASIVLEVLERAGLVD